MLCYVCHVNNDFSLDEIPEYEKIYNVTQQTGVPLIYILNKHTKLMKRLIKP